MDYADSGGRRTLADRFYCPNGMSEGRATLAGDEFRHLARVRRVVAGDVVELFDGRGGAFRARVAELHKDRASLILGEPIPDRGAASPLILATAVPKGERFDWLVEKATELGVARLVPLRSERSVVDPRPSKLDRLRRIIIEAAKQSRRNRLMDLDAMTSWDDFSRAEAGSDSTRLVAHPGSLPAASWPRIEPGRKVVLAIGPEGGFTDAEVDAAREAGWLAVDLGPTLLRIETAGLAGSAIILAMTGRGSH